MCLVYDVANLYQLAPLVESCRSYADGHATEILQSEAFLQLSPVSPYVLSERSQVSNAFLFSVNAVRFTTA